MTPEEFELLARAETLATTLLEPRAEAVDCAGTVPVENLDALAEAGLVGITTPRVFGGSEASEAFRRAFVETLCAACGTTYFVVTQHLGCCGQLAGSGNATLQALLPQMATGKHWVGVAFGHLRRPTPMLRATPVAGGWTLSGVAPWVTGWPILSGVIYGAHLPDGRHIYLYASAGENEHQHASAPLPLCAMNATETVEVALDGLFVPEESFIRYSSPAELARADIHNTVGNVAPMLGVARGSLAQLQRIAAKKPKLPAIAAAAAALDAELDDCRRTCYTLAAADKSTPGWSEAAHEARAWSIELGVRAAHAALAAGSGASNGRDNPAQRRFREAMFYTLFQQTGEVLSATVQRISRSQRSV